MTARNVENLRHISTFLMMQNTGPTKGYTAREIADAVPTLKESTVYRVLSTNPQFVQTENSIHPKRYYFDATRIPKGSASIDSMQIRPEFKAEPKPVTEWLQRLINATKISSEGKAETELYKEVRRLGIAANNALLFQANKEPLRPSDWEAAKFALDNLEQFAATLYQRIQQLKSDDRYGTPEWWAMFTKES